MFQKFLVALAIAYARVFSRPNFERFNTALITVGLMARGYNNFRSFEESGEEYFVRRVLAPTKPKLCLDIGACAGHYAKLLLENTSAKVIAFEPLPQMREAITQTLGGYEDRIVVEEMAVGSKDGPQTMFFSHGSYAHATLLREANKFRTSMLRLQPLSM